MRIFRKHQKQPALPSDIIGMMERFGRFEFHQQGSVDNIGDIWSQTQAPLQPFANADPESFLVVLAGAVLPVGGWAVCGASRTIFNVLSPSESVRRQPLYNAIMNASLAFLTSQWCTLNDA